MKAFSALVMWCLLSAMVAAEADEEAAAVARLVQESQRAGFERHDFDKYLTLWADDAKVIVGRSEKPGAHDTTISRAQIEATRRVLFRAEPPKEVKLTFANVRPEIDGDQATVRYRSTLRTKETEETVDEIFRLRKKDGRWKAFENRAWPVEARYGDKTTKYNAETWQALDAEVKRQEKDLAKRVPALLDAWRFAEAHATAKKWTEQAKDELDAWFYRGITAMAAGEAADGLASFDKVLAIDPKYPVPDYARVAKKK